MGLIFRKPETGSSALLNNQKADELLKALTDKTVKAVMRHQMTCAGTYYTASSVAKKYGLPLEEVQRALDMLFKIQFADARDVDMGEEQIKVYTIYGTYKMLLVYAIYSLAGRLADYQEHFYGFQGGAADWLSRMG